MLYRPVDSLSQSLRLLFQRRIRDGELAYLGDGTGRVEVPDRRGYVYARRWDGKAFSPPFIVRSAGAAFLNYEGAGVYIAIGYNGELQIVDAHHAELDRSGIDTRTLNPLHQQSKWVYLWQLTIGLASAVATTTNDSFLVTVKKFRHYVNNRFQTFETGLQADKLDVSAYNPTTDQHRYATAWTDTYRNEAEVTASTAQSLFTPLDSTDIQETVADRPPDAIPHKAFYLSNNQGTLTQQAASDVDLRQFLNTPQIHGFTSPVAYRERIQPGRQVLFAGTLQVTKSLEVLGSVVGVPSPGGNGSGGITQLTGDATAGPGSGSQVATLATVNSNVGTFRNARVTVNVKGLTTAAEDGPNIKPACRLATAAALPSCTYSNGSSGVGATLTATANGALSVDSVAVAAADRILVKNQVSTLQHGIYTVTQVGSGALPFILTRDTDSDASAKILRTVVFVHVGTVNAATWWTCANTSAITVGTTGITFTGGLSISPLSGAGQLITHDGQTHVAKGAGSVMGSVLAYNTFLGGSTRLSWDYQFAELLREGGVIRRLSNSQILISYVIAGFGETGTTAPVMARPANQIQQVLDMTTASHWVDGATAEAASEFVWIYIDINGTIYLHNKAPNVSQPFTTNPTMLVNQAGWNGTAGNGLNATSVVYDGDANEGNISTGDLALIYASTDTDYSLGRGRGSGAAGSRNNVSAALITAFNTGTNTLTLETGHNIAINDNDRIQIVRFAPLLWRSESAGWIRLLGAMYNNASSNLEDNRQHDHAYYVSNEGANYTIASTTFADTDGTNWVHTVLNDTGLIEAAFDGDVNHGGAGLIYFDLDIDGIRYAGDDGAHMVTASPNSSVFSVKLQRLIPVLFGTHTIRLQWKRVTAGTATLYAGAGTANADVHPQFSVKNVRRN